jgi:hypothetical protein
VNLGELRDAVRRNLGETEANADFWPSVDINADINEALTRFSREHPWPWLVTEGDVSILAGDETFDLTESVDFNRNVSFLTTPTGSARPYLLTRISAAQGFAMRAATGTLTSARPEWYYPLSTEDTSGDADFTTTLRLVPVPSENLDIEYQYYRVPAALEDDTDTPDLPREYHMALAYYARARSWEKETSQVATVKAQEQDSKYGYILSQAVDDYLNAAPDSPLIVGGRPPQRGGLGQGRWTDMRLPDTFGP